MTLKDRMKSLVGAGAKPADVPPVELEARLQAAKEVLESATRAAGAAALALTEGEPGAEARLKLAEQDRASAAATVQRLEGALAAATARQAGAEAAAQRKARRELVAQRTAALERFHEAAAEAEASEDAYVAGRVKMQRIIDDSISLFPEGTRAAISDSNNYVVAALFQKMHAARLPYAQIKILLPTGAPMWRDRLPGLDHAESK
jgi:hypothetical protein